jgi:hypothetical protein
VLPKGNETNQNSEDTKVNFSYFAVALIDIMKQKERLREITGLPDDKEKYDSFIAASKKSFGVVRGVRSTFDAFLSSYTGHTPQHTNKLTQDQVSLLGRMLKTEIRKQQFSDTIILYASLAETGDLIPINGVLGLFLALSATLIMTMSIGEIFRGGIDVGIGSSDCFGTEELYGPVLYQVYELESKKAQYPRILIGDSMRKYILNHFCPVKR